MVKKSTSVKRKSIKKTSPVKRKSIKKTSFISKIKKNTYNVDKVLNRPKGRTLNIMKVGTGLALSLGILGALKGMKQYKRDKELDRENKRYEEQELVRKNMIKEKSLQIADGLRNILRKPESDFQKHFKETRADFLENQHK